jgi:hypothetical protein
VGIFHDAVIASVTAKNPQKKGVLPASQLQLIFDYVILGMYHCNKKTCNAHAVEVPESCEPCVKEAIRVIEKGPKWDLWCSTIK